MLSCPYFLGGSNSLRQEHLIESLQLESGGQWMAESFFFIVNNPHLSVKGKKYIIYEEEKYKIKRTFTLFTYWAYSTFPRKRNCTYILIQFTLPHNKKIFMLK